ncbi:MAG: glycosyltransferase [Pseudomonadota bacterium]
MSVDAGETPSVAIVTPIYNEASTIARYIHVVTGLDPAPTEIVVVDGASEDDAPARARAAGLTVVEADRRGRAPQINQGVAGVSADYICVLHADTEIPHDAVKTIRTTLGDPRVGLAAFTPLIAGPDAVRWASSFHNWAKCWYAPFFFRPRFFFKGGRLLFGDQAMFFRRRDFLAVGGFDPDILVMEEADLCLKMIARGRQRVVNRLAVTSDRRFAEKGELRQNLLLFEIGLKWAFGFKKGLERRYPPVRRADQ